MKQTVSLTTFIEAFDDIRPDNFSHAGLEALFNWIEQLDDDCGAETELDAIALCCDFTEYQDLAEFQADYSSDYESIDDIQEETIVIPINDDSFIIQAF